MKETNARLARRWFREVWNERRAEAVDELAAPDCLGHHENGESRGPAAWKQLFADFMSAFSELQLTVEDVIADDSGAVVRWRATGRHTGPGLGLEPTRRRFDLRGMTWLRFEDGRIVEGWDCWNLGGLVQQLSQPA